MDDSPENTQDPTDNKVWSWFSWQVILLVLNAVLGLIAFEWAWASTIRNRTCGELHELMPAFRRKDAHQWRKWRFYPGAMTLLIPRLVLGILEGIVIVIQINLCLICHDRTRPLDDGCRKWCLKWVYHFGARALSFLILFTHQSHTYLSAQDVNHYEEWLGTKEEQA